MITIRTTFQRCLYMLSLLMLPMASTAQYQLPDPGFEDWSGATFANVAQPKYWHYSNVNQFSFDFNFSHPNTPGRNGGKCLYVEDQAMKVAGIDGGTSPGYAALGNPWAYVPSLTNIAGATAGCTGGISWKQRPDTVALWIKRTGNKWADENYNIVFYMWKGTAKSNGYPSDNGCTKIEKIDEECDIRIALDANSCGTNIPAEQIGEALWYEKKQINEWTRIKIPVYYMNSEIPEKCNLILSAGNYPAGKSKDGFYAGNGLYVDDVELIYASTIQKLYVNNKEWKGFDPNSNEVQTYSLGKGVTTIPEIYAMRGVGSETNCMGLSYNFVGRRLSSDEITIQNGKVDSEPTIITVKAADGSSEHTYRIQFVSKASSNARLASIEVNGNEIPGFSGYITDYNYALPYKTATTPVVTASAQDGGSTIEITQPTSTTGTATIKVVAQDGVSTMTYKVQFSVAQLSDVSLKDILVDGTSLADFSPNKTSYVYTILPDRTTVPTVTPISAYGEGEQTIEITQNTIAKGCQIKVSAPGATTARIYKITYKQEEPPVLSTNRYLKSILIDGTPLKGFRATTYNYTYTCADGTTTAPVITWENGDDKQTVVFTPGGLNAASTIEVTAENGDKSTYSVLLQTKQSSNCNPAMINLDGQPLNGFSATKTSYQVSVEAGAAWPVVTVDKGDAGQQIVITQATNESQKATVVVTAGNGTSRTYTILFLRQEAARSTNAQLNMIYLNGLAMTDFSKTRYSYKIKLSAGEAIPAVTIEQGDDKQTVQTKSQDNSVVITVTAEAGNQKTYTLSFITETAAISTVSTLDMIYYGEEEVENFHPLVAQYVVYLKDNNLPAVRVSKGDEKQTVTISNATDTTNARIVVTAEAGNSRTYAIQFVQANQTTQKGGGEKPQPIVDPTAPALPDYQPTLASNPKLKAIYLDGTALSGFQSDKYDYIVENSTRVPDIIDPVTMDEVYHIRIQYGALDATSIITVTAQDSVAIATYRIRFKTTRTNTASLASIDADGYDLGYDADKTDYQLTLPHGATWPAISYEADNKYQTVKVWSEEDCEHKSVRYEVISGDSLATKTYTIDIRHERPKNILLSLAVNEIAMDLNQQDFHVVLPYGSTEPTIQYVKQYDGQQVVIANGGALRPTTITVYSAYSDEEPVVYTIHPTLQTAHPATLKKIRINGVEIADFDPNVFSCIANVTDRPAIDAISWEKQNADAEAEITEQDNKHCVISVSYGLTTNKYTVYYYYENDVIPTDFNNWVSTKYNNAKKPKGWVVPADAAQGLESYSTGGEVSRVGDYVALKTIYTTTIHSTIAGMMTLGKMNMTLGTNGSTTSSVEGGITFRNTPNKITVEAMPVATDEMENWRMLATINGSEDVLYKGDFNNIGTWRTVEMNWPKVADPQTLNLTINSAQSENSDDLCSQWVWLTGRGKSSTLYIRNLQVCYNSTLDSIMLNGHIVAAGSEMKDTLPADMVGQPAIRFFGQTADQHPVLSWSEEIDHQRTLTIRNKAEDGSYTDYTVSIYRPVSSNADTAYMHLDGHDLKVAPASAYAQLKIDTITNGYRVTITAEDGTVNTYEKTYTGTATPCVLEKDSTIQKPFAPSESVTREEPIYFDLDEEDALEMITLNSLDIEGFDPEVLGYELNTRDRGINYRTANDKQHVEVQYQVVGNVEYYYLDCYAQSGKHRRYSVRLNHRLASDTVSLAAIRMNGQNLQNFDEEQIFYRISLEAETVMPQMAWELTDAKATYEATLQSRVSENGIITHTYTCKVTAEDGVHTRTYIVEVEMPAAPNRGVDPDPSEAQYGLEMIYINGEKLDGFDKEITDHTYYLSPCDSIRSVIVERQNTEQKVNILQSEKKIEIAVENPNGTKTAYTIEVEELESENHLLKAILVNGKPLNEYRSDSTFYSIELARGDSTLPTFSWETGDCQQTVDSTITGDATSGWDCTLIVTAGDQSQQRYTILVALAEPVPGPGPGTVPEPEYYSVRMIYVNGKELSGFMSDIPTGYNVELEPCQSVESIIVNCSHGEEQQVTIDSTGYPIHIEVLNPDSTILSYDIEIREKESTNTRLAMIWYDDNRLPDFDPARQNDTTTIWLDEADFHDYTLRWETSDCQQQVSLTTEHIREKADTSIIYSLEVTAGSMDEDTYVIRFALRLDTENRLSDLKVKGTSIMGFDPDVEEYILSYPLGTKEEEFATAADVEAVILSPYAVVESIEMNAEKSISIMVRAQDSVSIRSYTIRQELALSNNALLADLRINGITIDGFLPTVFNYTYQVKNTGSTSLPADFIEGIAQDTLSEVWITFKGEDMLVGDTLQVHCLAEDGVTEEVYSVAVIFGPEMTGEPTMDVCRLVQIPGTTQFKAVTLRYNTHCYLYDLSGHMVWSSNDEYITGIPVSDPNYVTVVKDEYGNDRLAAVDERAEGATTCKLQTGNIYIAVFFTNVNDRKQRISKGQKIVVGR